MTNEEHRAQYIYDLATIDASEQWAQRFAAVVHAPLIVTLSGSIGAGKTTLVRAMLRALGVSSAIKSPTFSLIESYKLDNFIVHHVDLYRISDESELDCIGFRDYFSQDAICCIEWPEQAPLYFGSIDVALTLESHRSGRLLSVRALTTTGAKVLSALGENA